MADYCDVDPLFGTLADFDAMLARAHELGIRVIVDVVPNHSSSEHPWFTTALAAAPGDPARDRYVFRDGRGRDGSRPPNNWVSIFGGPAWTRVEDGQWYLHLFDASQPDLNWWNDEIGDEFESILRFWLDRGVDGFRVDAAHGLYKEGDLTPRKPGDKPPHPMWDQPEVHEVYRRWRKILDEYDGDRMAVAEACAGTPEAMARYIREDELQQTFNFTWLEAPLVGGRVPPGRRGHLRRPAGRRHPDLGALQPRRGPRGHPVRRRHRRRGAVAGGRRSR